MIGKIKEAEIEKYGFTSMYFASNTLLFLIEKHKDKFKIEELVDLVKHESVEDEIDRLFQDIAEDLEIPRYLLNDFEKTFREDCECHYWEKDKFGRHKNVYYSDDVIDGDKERLFSSIAKAIENIKYSSIMEREMFKTFLDKYFDNK